MTCIHQSIKSRTLGNTDNCILCGIEIVFDGRKWTWLFGIEKKKRDAMTARIPSTTP